jgi:hypothetical protein
MMQLQNNDAQFQSVKGITQIDRTKGATYDRGNGRVEQLLPSHVFQWQNRLQPIASHSLEENLVRCFDSLIRAYRSDGLELATIYCEMFFGEFWRQTYYRDFPHFKLARNAPKAQKELVRLEANTWIAALDCLKAINERRHGWQFNAPYTNIGFALTMLIFEGGILNWSVDRFQNKLSLGQSAESMRSHQQSISKALSEGRSPFSEEFFTHSFVLACLAGEDYPNLYRAWQRLLKARSVLLQYWRTITPVSMSPETGEILDPKMAAKRKKQASQSASKNTRKDLM